jgi:hypothetical protein
MLSELLWDFVIVDWSDLFDAKQQPIPCTKEMKLLLMGRSPSFSALVSGLLADLRVVEDKEAEDLPKN